MPRIVKMCLVPAAGLLLVTTICALALTTPERTKGYVWPKPRFVNYKTLYFTLYSTQFSFKVTGETCDILQKAITRYTEVIKRTAEAVGSSECESQHNVTKLGVELTAPCQSWPTHDMKENYELHVNSDSALLKSDSIWGILRGLESFSQIVTSSKQLGCLVVNQTDMLDYPRFSHRGLLLDTSRHYLPDGVILNILSAMEMNKMNVFHWHIVDDESFPYQSTTFPSLSEKGAYDPKKAIYTQETIKSIIDYARLRGIRVLPEFDSPGHTQSWGKGVNKLLTPCYSSDGTFNGNFGPVDPSRQENYKFITSLLKEVKNVFPGNYIHVGGDEVNFSCWKSNPAIQKFMVEKEIKSYEELEGYYFKKVFNILRTMAVNGIVWEEVFIHNPDLPNNTIVHNWSANRTNFLPNVTSKGLQALLSEGWYLDHISDQWENFYRVDPTDFNGTKAQKNLVLGGEACMWGEMVDETNIVPRIWPRASAVAERLWSSEKEEHIQSLYIVYSGWFDNLTDTNLTKVNNVVTAAPRLNEHVCRMKWRGVAAQPANGYGYCTY